MLYSFHFAILFDSCKIEYLCVFNISINQSEQEEPDMLSTRKGHVGGVERRSHIEAAYCIVHLVHSLSVRLAPCPKLYSDDTIPRDTLVSQCVLAVS